MPRPAHTIDPDNPLYTRIRDAFNAALEHGSCVWRFAKPGQAIYRRQLANRWRAALRAETGRSQYDRVVLTIDGTCLTFTAGPPDELTLPDGSPIHGDLRPAWEAVNALRAAKGLPQLSYPDWLATVTEDDGD